MSNELFSERSSFQKKKKNLGKASPNSSMCHMKTCTVNVMGQPTEEVK